MSHASKNNALTDELVQLITGYSPTNNARAYQACKDAAFKSLRRHQYGRTNQFAVRNSFFGLVEKFEVLNKDDLAQELDDRLSKLSSKADKWTPEILCLLLNLSDNPGKRSRVDELKSQNAPKPLPSWTWEDEWVDDPFPDTQLWEDIDHARESSDEETTVHTPTFSEETESTLLSNFVEDDRQPSAESLVLRRNPAALEEIRLYQQLNIFGAGDPHVELTELHLVREILSALRGLPSALFKPESTSDHFLYRQGCQLTNLSLPVLEDVGESFADILTQTQRLRKFCVKPRTALVLQKFSHSVALRISSYDGRLSCIEERLVGTQDSVAVSLLDLRSDVEAAARPVLQLEQVVKEAGDLHEHESYRILEILYARLCDAQLMEDQESYQTFGTVFLEILETYLQPIRRWMRHGEVGDYVTQNDFIIGLQDDDDALETFWSKRFFIRQKNGEPVGPKFLHIFYHDILAAGKHVAFMKQLGMPLDTSPPHRQDAELLELDLNYADIAPTFSLIPFTTYFTHVLTRYFDQVHRPTSLRLKSYLLTLQDLRRTTVALQTLYLSHCGAYFTDFATQLFAKLDAADPTWTNSLVLHDLIVSTFGQSPFVNADAINVSSSQTLSDGGVDSSQRQRSVKALARVEFEYNYLWPVANVIPPSSLSTYQATFTLLLQLQRASFLLSSLRLIPFPCTGPSSATGTLLTPSARQYYASYHHLRHRLIFLVNTLRDHLLNTHIAPLSRDLAAATESALDVDSLITAHQKFSTALARGALLVKDVVDIKSSVVALLDLCVLFVDLARDSRRDFEVTMPTARRPVSRSPGDDVDDSEQDEKVELGKSHDDSIAASAYEADASEDNKSAKTPAQASPDVRRRVERMREQVRQLLSLIISGLRSASRHNEGESEESWTILAERLDMAAPLFLKRVT